MRDEGRRKRDANRRRRRGRVERIHRGRRKSPRIARAQSDPARRVVSARWRLRPRLQAKAEKNFVRRARRDERAIAGTRRGLARHANGGAWRGDDSQKKWRSGKPRPRADRATQSTLGTLG